MAVRISRRSFLIGSAATMAGSVAAYSYWYEPAHTVLERITITLGRLPAGFDGVTIAQVTDVHHSAYVSLEHIRQAVQVLKAEAPDLVVLTGDFVSLPEGSRSAVYAEPCARALADLHGSVGSFAVLGNHDHHVAPDRVTGALQAAGFTVLLNQARPIERHGHRLGSAAPTMRWYVAPISPAPLKPWRRVSRRSCSHTSRTWPTPPLNIHFSCNSPDTRMAGK
jgi:predicted MPP superfamily phosphohydrolase